MTRKQQFVVVVLLLILLSIGFLFLSSEQVEAYEEYVEELEDLFEEKIEEKKEKEKLGKLFVEDIYGDLAYLDNLRDNFRELMFETRNPYDHQVFLDEGIWNQCFHDNDFFKMVI